MYVITGVLLIIGLVVTFFVLRVFASDSEIFVGDCTPYNVDISKGGHENTVEISWESKKPCSGYLLYGGEMKDLDMVGVDLENEAEGRYHIVEIKELLTSKRYYFTIISNGVSYGKDGLPIQFTIDSL